jgi:hypothetical protein
MTPLKPIEQVWGIRGVAAEKYPLNKRCAHPACNEPVTGAHHCFPRSQTKSDSYFVEIDTGEGKTVIPHAVGLCGSGTTGHHGDVEEHRGWIKLEDGNFIWYERADIGDRGHPYQMEDWKKTGPLNPQPGSRDPRRKRVVAQGKERRKRKIIGIRVPADETEDGAGLLEDLHHEVEALLGHDPPRSLYYCVVDCMNFTLLNG